MPTWPIPAVRTLRKGFPGGRVRRQTGLPLQSGSIWDGGLVVAAHAQAVRWHLVRDAQIGSVNSVISYSQPVVEAFGHAVARFTGSRPHCLAKRSTCYFQASLGQHRTRLGQVLPGADRHAIGNAGTWVMQAVRRRCRAMTTPPSPALGGAFRRRCAPCAGCSKPLQTSPPRRFGPPSATASWRTSSPRVCPRCTGHGCSGSLGLEVEHGGSVLAERCAIGGD